VNSRAAVSVPKMNLKRVRIREGDTEVWRKDRFIKGAPGFLSGQEECDYITFKVGSGCYSLKLTGVR
jgi:hypothetical protein